MLIQNSTLAGGVAIGSAANLHLSPAGALVVGVIIGLVSVEGYTILQPFLESNIGLRDTCGVHNLHGLPGLLGGVVAGKHHCFLKSFNARWNPLSKVQPLLCSIC